jgi:hypothetical protein
MNQPIGMLGSKLLSTSEALGDINEESVECFRTFGSEKCSPLVAWIRTTMPGKAFFITFLKSDYILFLIKLKDDTLYR